MFREGVKNYFYRPVHNFLSPPSTVRQKTFFCELLIFFFFFLIIRYAYQKMQNGLKRMFFMKEKNFGSKKVFNGYPCKNVTKYLTPILVAARGLTPSTVYGPVCNL